MFAELAKWWKRIENPAAASPRDYRAYTTEFDRIIHGDDLPALFSPEQEAAFEARVAEVDPVLSQWRTAAELVAIDDVKAYAAKHSADDPNDTVACLLVDHSGSLRGQPAVLTTAVAEVAADYWSRIGISYEILGFTTLTWRGGRSREKWMNSGHPRNPGRHLAHHLSHGRC
jgi:cobaltochelatase CobT